MKETHVKGYVVTFALLLGLAAVNIWVSEANVGGLNTAIILAVACVQAFVLAAFFMHLRESPKFLWVVVFSGFFFVGVLAVYVVADNHGRATMPRPPLAWEKQEKLPPPAASSHHEAPVSQGSSVEASSGK